MFLTLNKLIYIYSIKFKFNNPPKIFIMKKLIAINCFLLLTIAGVFAQGTDAVKNPSAKQINYSSELKSSELSIIGTSTLHDWESKVEDYQVKAVRNGKNISANLIVQVKSIKSGKTLMDNNTYKALNIEEYPVITMNALNLLIEGDIKISGTGKLTIAGVTKTIPLTMEMTSWAEESITVIGKVALKMTDFNIEPPIALFGTVKTGDEITIKFNITLLTN